MVCGLAFGTAAFALPGCIWKDVCVGGTVRREGRCVSPDAGTSPAEGGAPLDAAACDPSACPARPWANSTCREGRCDFTCNEGRGDCDGEASNGCEADVLASAETCGTCDTSCAWGCMGGTCDDPVAIAVGWRHACALRSGGRAYCWGQNTEGQLGNGTMDASRIPVPVSAPADLVAIGAGASFSCALRESGEILCWGFNQEGQIGNGSLTRDSEPSPVSVGGLSDAVELAVGGAHACARRMSGSVACWGWNADGQIGDGTVANRTAPRTVITLTDAAEVDTGAAHTCARRASGQIVCWGDNSFGQLGDGTFTDRTSPVAASGVTSAVSLALGAGHSCALSTSGSVSCWGQNSHGELGRGTRTMSTPYGIATPGEIPGLADVAQLAAGGHFFVIEVLGHSCAVSATGVVCWGDNTRGQLGSGDFAGSTTPIPVMNADNVSQVAIGGAATCVLRTDHTVWCTGWNMDGQLGDGTTVDSSVLVQVQPPADG